MLKPKHIILLKRVSEESGISLEVLKEEVEELKQELKGFVSYEGCITQIKEKYIKNKKQEVRSEKMDDLESFFQDLDIKNEEFPEFLKIQNDIVFTLKFEDPSQHPRKYKDGYKNEKYGWNVILMDIEPDEAKSEYVLNRVYSLSLGKRAMRRFKQFWLSVGNKYEEKFTFKRTGVKFETDYEFKLVE